MCAFVQNIRYLLGLMGFTCKTMEWLAGENQFSPATHSIALHVVNRGPTSKEYSA
jgi:hypothetical protein